MLVSACCRQLPSTCCCRPHVDVTRRPSIFEIAWSLASTALFYWEILFWIFFESMGRPGRGPPPWLETGKSACPSPRLAGEFLNGVAKENSPIDIPNTFLWSCFFGISAPSCSKNHIPILLKPLKPKLVPSPRVGVRGIFELSGRSANSNLHHHLPPISRVPWQVPGKNRRFCASNLSTIFWRWPRT